MIPADQAPWRWLVTVVEPDHRRPGPKKVYLVAVDERETFRGRAGSAVRVVEDLRPNLAPGARVSIVLPARVGA